MQTLRFTVVALCVLTMSSVYAAAGQPRCQKELTESKALRIKDNREALKNLSAALLQISPELAKEEWHQMLTRVLATFHTSDMVVCGFFGPQGMGSSTMTNLVCQLITGKNETVSPVKRIGPTTRCPLVVMFNDGSPSPEQTSAATALSKSSGSVSEATLAYDQRCVEIDERFPEAEPYVLGQPLPASKLTRIIHLASSRNKLRVALLDGPNGSSGNAESKLDTKPEFEKVARSALLAADVRIVVVNDTYLNNKSFKRIMIDSNKKMGGRRTVFILRTNAKTDEERQASESALKEATHNYFTYKKDQPGVLPEVAEEVLALYTVPENPDVQADIVLPTPRPLPGYMEFPELWDYIDRESLNLKVYAARKAGRASATQMRDVLDQSQKQQAVIAVYREALGLALAIPPEKLLKFPYKGGKGTAARWRALYKATRPGWKMPKIADKLTAPARAAGDAVENVGTQARDFAVHTAQDFINRVKADSPAKTWAPRVRLSADEVIKATNVQMKSEWTRLATAVFNNLELGIVQLRQEDAAKLLTTIKDFNTKFIGHEISVLFPGSTALPDPAAEPKVEPELVTVKLPSKELLSPAAQAGLSEVLKRGKNIAGILFGEEGAGQHVTVTTSNDGQGPAADPGDSARSPEEMTLFSEQRVAEGLKAILQDKMARTHNHKLFDGISILATGLPALITVGRVVRIIKVAGAATGPGLGLLAGGWAASSAVRLANDRRIDRDLRPQLESWFADYQKSEITNLIRGKLLGPFTRELDSAFEALEKAHINIERALSVFIPEPETPVR